MEPCFPKHSAAPANHRATFMTATILLLASSLAADLQFANSYQADELPENASPKWVEKGNAAETSVADGCLSVKSDGAGKRQFYVFDQTTGGWDMTSGRATVEFRIRCASDDPEDEVFRVQFSDGTQMWRAVFFNDRCNGAKADTADWDTYRLTVRDGKLQIRSEKLGIIAADIPSAPQEDVPSILFGTFKGSPQSAHRSWDLDFIRWTNDDVQLP